VTIAESTRTPTGAAVLVCALGRVGLQCVRALRGYRVPVLAIDFKLSDETLTELGAGALIEGDFRDPDTLRKAGVARCRAIALLSADPAANIEGALAARRVNPTIRLVVRAEERSWHRLLASELGNIVVYEPNRLAEAAFAFSALDSHVLAHFYVHEHLFQVVDHVVAPGDRWLGERIEGLHAAERQPLLHLPAQSAAAGAEAPEFNGWGPDQTLAVGDRLLSLSTTSAADQPAARRRRSERPRAAASNLYDLFRHFIATRRREKLSRPAKVTLFGAAALAGLIVTAALAFSFGPPHLPASEALRLSILLLFGGHLADVFADFESLPGSVQWAEVFLTICGTVLTAVVYALLTDRLLTAHFQLRAGWSRAPERDHVIVAGHGDTAARMASQLAQFRCSVVSIEARAEDAQPELPAVIGSPRDAATLRAAHVGEARGLIAATANDQHNVEIALLASALNPHCSVVVRTFDPRFSGNVAFLLPQAKVLCVASLAATAYAAAALGEHVLHLFETPERSVLVVEYEVAADDTLVGRALYEVAEGYSIVPVLHQRAGAAAIVPKPEHSGLHLAAGDRLVVLATAASLEAIERGELRPPTHELWLERLQPYAEPVRIVSLLSQRLGYTLEQAYAALDALPQRAPTLLYGLYASRTQRVLVSNGVEARIARGSEQPG
jgi:Trk K+ transport system NAD-binding subunit